MNASMLMPFMLMASAKKSRRKRLAEALLPAMIPLPPAQQVAVSSVMADMQVRREERRVKTVQAEEEQIKLKLALEAAALGDSIVKGDEGKKITVAILAENAPNLAKLLEKYPSEMKKFIVVDR